MNARTVFLAKIKQLSKRKLDESVEKNDPLAFMCCFTFTHEPHKKPDTLLNLKTQMNCFMGLHGLKLSSD